jgi:potassium-dependent mechanosensitive channel
MSGASRRLRHLLAASLIAFSLMACGPGEDRADTWNDLLKGQERGLSNTAKRVEQLTKDLSNRLAGMQKHLYVLRGRYDLLMFYFDLRSENPLVLRDILGAIQWFETETRELTRPFTYASAGLTRILDNLSDLSQKVEQESEAIHALKQPAVSARVLTYRNDIASLQERIRSLQTSLTRGLNPAESFAHLLAKDHHTVSHSYNQVLATHLFKRSPSCFTEKAWSEGLESAQKWTAIFGIYLLEPVQLKATGWAMLGIRCLLFSLGLATMSLIALRRLGRRFEGISKDRRLFSFCILWSVGLGLLLAIASTGLFPSSFFSTAATVLLVRGLISLSRSLRHQFLPEVESEPNRLTPLWAAVSLISLLEALHMPEAAFIPAWAAALTTLCWYYIRRTRPRDGWANLPRLVMIGITPVLTLAALLGWGHLTLLAATMILLFSLSFRLAQGVSSGMSLAASRWQGRKADSEASRVPNVRGLGFPLIFISLLLASLAWVLTFVGGGSLFLEVIRHRVGWDSFTFSIYRIFCILFLLFAVRAGIAIARSAIERLPDRYRDLDAASVQSIDSIVTYALWSLFFLSSLGLLGLSFRNLAVIAGGLSVGLGFGLQTIVNNFFGGLILLFGRSIQPGDLLELDQLKGYVKKVTIRNTLVQTFSGATVFVPNSLLVSQKLINWTYGDRKYRQEIQVGVAYGSDVEQVTQLLLEAARQSSKVLSVPPPRVRFLDFGDSTLVFSLRVWIKGWADRYADSEVRYHMTRLFRENGIEISFPQLDVHIKSSEGVAMPRE